MAKKPTVSQISIGDFVRLSDSYFRDWTTLSPYIASEMRDTIFIVIDESRGNYFEDTMMFSLKAVAGGMLGKQNEMLFRADKDLELLKPEDVDMRINTMIQNPLDPR